MKAIKLFSILLLVAACLQVAASDRQTRKINGFHAISVTSGIDLYLTQKNDEEVTVEAETEDLDKIITEVEGGMLHIYIKEKSWLNLNWNSKPRKVYVSFKTLDKLDASAGSDVVAVSPIKVDNIRIDASSGSDVKLEVSASEMRVSSSSGSDITLKGSTNKLEVDASSGSDINAGELTSKDCDASVSSGSDIKVIATETLKANASSGGDISYSGNPKTKDINKSSGGDVHGR